LAKTKKLQVYLDDVYAGPIIYDTISPVIDSAFILSDSTIQLNFSEVVDTILALNITNYYVDNGLGFPAHIQWIGNDFKKVLLKLTYSMRV
jgi:hypothetical protein